MAAYLPHASLFCSRFPTAGMKKPKAKGGVMMTKRAMGNLLNRYRAVLKKCHLMNTFGSLAVASILVMGATSGEAFGNAIGYDLASPSTPRTTVSVTDESEDAVASSIKADVPGTYAAPDTIARAEATAIGTQSALSFGVFVQNNTNKQLTVNINQLDSVTQSITENGTSRSVGILSDKNGSVSINGGTIVSSSKSKNGVGESFGIVCNHNSSITSGINSIILSSESNKHISDPQSVGVYFSDNSNCHITSDKLRIDMSAINNGDVYSKKIDGIYGEKNSTLTMNDADISVHGINNNPDKSGVAGIHLSTASTLAMKDAAIRVTATNPEGGLAGSAVGIVTSPTSGRHNMTAGALDIRAQGGWATGMLLRNTDIRVAGGTIMSKAREQAAYGIQATQTNFTATGDIDITTQADMARSAVAAILSMDNSSFTMRGGAVTVSSKGDGGAIGLYAKGGGTITKTGGDIAVSAGVAIGMETLPASKITYGDAKATTRVTVDGMEAYGIRVRGQASTGQNASIELTNGVIRAQSSGDTAIGAYSSSGDISLKGTTAITATAAAPGQKVYSLYAKGDTPSTITVDKASTMEGDMETATPSATVRAFIQDGGSLRGWARSQGDLDLSFGKKAVWEVVSSNQLTKESDGRYAGNLTKLALDGAHVYVGSRQGQWNAGTGFASSQRVLSQTDAPAELKISHLSGAGDFYLRTDMETDSSDSVLVTDSLSGTYALHVNASGAEPVAVQTKSYLARAEQNVGAAASAFALKGGKKVNGREMIDIGIYDYVLETSERNDGREWYLARTEGFSPTGEMALGLSGMTSAYAMHMSRLSDLRERLGEIRYGNGTDGLWVRGFTEENRLSGLGGTDFSQNVYGTSFGYDRLLEQDENNKWLLGLRGQISRAHQRVDGPHGGTGDNRSYGIAAYATWQHTEGWYADTVLSWDWYDQNLKTRMLDGTPVHGAYHTYAGGISQEVGRMFRFDNGLFVEPQLQLSWYWMKGMDFTTSNGMDVDQDDACALTGRAGLVVGKKWDLDNNRYFQPYLKAGVNHEFMGDQQVTVNGIRFTNDLRGTRGYYGAGFDLQFASNARIYAEFEREDGQRASTPWSVGAGLRVEF